MSSRKTAQLVLLDLVGAGVVLAALLGFVYLMFFRENTVQYALGDLRNQVRTMEQELATLETSLGDEQERLSIKQAELQETGNLPDRSPIEEDLETLSVLAGENSLKVIRVDPLPPAEYPGLLEVRYSFQAQGSMPDLVRFFKAIEDASFWADVSYFRIGRGGRGMEEQSAIVDAQLTISLFSSSS